MDDVVACGDDGQTHCCLTRFVSRAGCPWLITP